MAYLSVEARYELAIRGAEVLYRRGAQRVWLFGSLAKGKLQDQRSDLDLIVEGLPFPFTHQLVRDVYAAVGFPIDVMELESMPPDYRGNVIHTLLLVPRNNGSERSALPAVMARAPHWRRLNQQRLESVVQRLKESNARSVLDLGCGNGILLEMLALSGSFERLTGIDYSEEALSEADARFRRRLSLTQRSRIRLVHGLVSSRSSVMPAHDAVTAVEVIEHLQPAVLAAFGSVVFEYIQPRIVLMTTPNAEFNALFRRRTAANRRHEEHVFEWSRAECAAWATRLAERYGYITSISPLGTVHPLYGPPSLLLSFQGLDRRSEG